MEGFGLLLGHLVGDYVLQNDWMAANKVATPPGEKPAFDPVQYASDGGDYERELAEWEEKCRAYRVGHLACTVHCLLYTLSVWTFSYSWMPYWGLLLCFLAHWPVDRFRLARVWMERVSGQKVFADKLGPWSVIIVDNVYHLVTLYVIAALAGRS